MIEGAHVAPMSLTKPKPTHRYRVCGTPSRLGCLTCKVRRVKCGEEKPFCRRCTSTGRKCDGYETTPIPNVPSHRKTPKTTTNSPTEDSLEQQYLEYFSIYTVSVLSGNFSPDFWERRVLQASQIQPSIRHAIIAIAAVHHDFDNKQKNGGETNCSLESFAFRQYTKAITHLHNLMSTTQHLDLTLITCILFISFDCLLGNHASAVMHLKAGLKILEDIRTRNPNKEIQIHEWEREFAPPLLSLGVQVATFISPQFPEERRTLWMALQSAGVSSQPTTFWSLDEARYALNSLSSAIMAELILANSSILEHRAPTSVDFPKRGFAQALEAWSAALEQLIPQLLAAESPVGKTSRASTLLKIHALVVSIVIGLPQNAEAKFEKIVTLCGFLIAANNTAQGTNAAIFSCDQGIIAPLFFASWRAPSLSVKQQAIELLLKTPGREGLWDAADAHRVAQDHLEAEDKKPSSTMPEPVSQVEARIWHDIGARLKHRTTWNMEENMEERQESVPALEAFARSKSSGPQTLSSPSSDTTLNSSEELYASPVMGFQEDIIAPVPRSGFSSSAYGPYNNE